MFCVYLLKANKKTVWNAAMFLFFVIGAQIILATRIHREGPGILSCQDDRAPSGEFYPEKPIILRTILGMDCIIAWVGIHGRVSIKASNWEDNQYALHRRHWFGWKHVNCQRCLLNVISNPYVRSVFQISFIFEQQQRFFCYDRHPNHPGNSNSWGLSSWPVRMTGHRQDNFILRSQSSWLRN